MAAPRARVDGRVPVTQTGGALAVAPVDLCLTPLGPGPMVPVPYVNIAPAHALQGGSVGVTLAGASVMLADSILRYSYGNEAGVGGGVRSGMQRGPARAVQHSMVVTMEGQGVVRVGDVTLQNGDNAIGRLTN